MKESASAQVCCIFKCIGSTGLTYLQLTSEIKNVCAQGCACVRVVCMCVCECVCVCVYANVYAYLADASIRHLFYLLKIRPADVYVCNRCCIPDEATLACTQIHASVAPGLQMMSGLYVSADEAPFIGCVRCGPRYVRGSSNLSHKHPASLVY
jgi:hypothetical protein